jgi:hypothetical protein
MYNTVMNYIKSFKGYAKGDGVSEGTNQNCVVVVCQLVYRVPSALQGSSDCLGFHSRLPFF